MQNAEARGPLRSTAHERGQRGASQQQGACNYLAAPGRGIVPQVSRAGEAGLCSHGVDLGPTAGELGREELGVPDQQALRHAVCRGRNSAG